MGNSVFGRRRVDFQSRPLTVSRGGYAVAPRAATRGGRAGYFRRCAKSSTALRNIVGWSTNVMCPLFGKMTSFAPGTSFAISSAIHGALSS